MFPEQIKIQNQISHLMSVFYRSECEIRPHFFLTGPSGSGKSYLVEQCAKEVDMPVIEINAAQLTSEGVSGNSLSKALRPLREHWNEPSIIFVDEFDKVVQRNGEDTEGFRSIVQDEFLRVLEAKNTSVFTDYGKYQPVRVDKTLFIFAGAFSNQVIGTTDDLKEAGLRNEFVGRVPLVFRTEEISINSMLRAIPRLKLLDDYLRVFPNVSKKKAIADIGNMLSKDKRAAVIGARLLNSLVHSYFMKDI